MSAANMPHNSHQITISPLLVRVVGQPLAPASVLQGDTKVPLMAVTITPSINQVVISTLTLTQTGTIQSSTGTPPNRPGDGDFSKLYVYLDADNNGKLKYLRRYLVGIIDVGATTVGQFYGRNRDPPVDRSRNF